MMIFFSKILFKYNIIVWITHVKSAKVHLLADIAENTKQGVDYFYTLSRGSYQSNSHLFMLGLTMDNKAL